MGMVLLKKVNYVTAIQFSVQHLILIIQAAQQLAIQLVTDIMKATVKKTDGK